MADQRADDGSTLPPRQPSEAPTAAAAYTERLRRLQLSRWKSWPLVQLPFRLHLSALKLGRCLDVGCGVGRLLRHLGPGSIGVDHNPTSVALCRDRGLTALTTVDLSNQSPLRGVFDSLLIAHVLEHLDQEGGDALLAEYLPYLAEGAKVVVFTPQEVGQRSDSTHVRWVDHEAVGGHARRLGWHVARTYSFPLPRPLGRLFVYNEFVTVLRRD